MLFDMFLQFRGFTQVHVFQSCPSANCQDISFFHWYWASGFADKFLEDVKADFWKISDAKIPVLWIPGETKADTKNF